MRNAVILALVLALAACSPKTDGAKAPGVAQAQSEASRAFMTKIGKEAGVVVLPSGLAYRIVRSGPATGLKPQLTDEVKVHYEGKLEDGKVFDSSYERGQPAAMPLRGLVPGWQEALQLMRPGDDAFGVSERHLHEAGITQGRFCVLMLLWRSVQPRAATLLGAARCARA
eukprot:gene11308-15215_t